jgi:sugar phosphate isomerase/epimerase
MFTLATKTRPTRRGLTVVQQSGFSAVELWTDANILRRHEAVIALSRGFALDYALHFPNRCDLTPELLRDAGRLYEQLDCRAMVIHDPVYQRYGDQLLGINPSLRLGVENHQLTISQFHDWAERNRWLTLDIEHLWMLTLENGPLALLLDTLYEFLRRYSEKLVHVHLPGYIPHYDEHRPMYCSREMVMSALSLLADVRFDGFVVSEVNTEYQNICDLNMDVLLWRRWQQLREQSNKWCRTAPAQEDQIKREVTDGEQSAIV